MHKLTRLPNGVESKNLFTLVGQMRSNPLVLGVIMPVLLVGPWAVAAISPRHKPEDTY